MIRLLLHDGTQRSLAPEPGQTLAQAIFLAGLWEGVPLCAGLGKCGLCRVRFQDAAPEPRAEETRRLAPGDPEVAGYLAAARQAGEKR